MFSGGIKKEHQAVMGLLQVAEVTKYNPEIKYTATLRIKN